jgi:recombination protein RecT
MSTQLTTRHDKVSSIRALLDKSKQQIRMALPSHLNPDRMLRIAMTSIQRNPSLLDCTPESLIGAIIQSSQLGLEPDGVLGHAYLVPYGKVCTFIPGYKGLMALARRSGEISTIYAEVVHAKDVFEYELGLNAKLKHVPTDDEDEGAFTGVYAVAKLKDGGIQFVVLKKGAIERIRKRSKASNNGPWVTDYEEMAKKTALRRLCKHLPCSVELEKAVALDERAEIGLPQEIDMDLSPEGETKPASKLDAITPGATQGELIEGAEAS